MRPTFGTDFAEVNKQVTKSNTVSDNDESQMVRSRHEQQRPEKLGRWQSTTVYEALDMQSCDDDDERRRSRTSRSEDRVNLSARYDGAVPRKHSNVRTEVSGGTDT